MCFQSWGANNETILPTGRENCLDYHGPIPCLRPFYLSTHTCMTPKERYTCIEIQPYNLTCHVISVSQRLWHKDDKPLPLGESELSCKTGQMRQMSHVFVLKRFTASYMIHMKSPLSSGRKVTNQLPMLFLPVLLLCQWVPDSLWCNT